MQKEIQSNSRGLLSFVGSISSINMALSGMRYTPTSDFHGETSLVVSVDDNGNTGKMSESGQTVHFFTFPVSVKPVDDLPKLFVSRTSQSSGHFHEYVYSEDIEVGFPSVIIDSDNKDIVSDQEQVIRLRIHSSERRLQFYPGTHNVHIMVQSKMPCF